MRLECGLSRRLCEHSMEGSNARCNSNFCTPGKGDEAHSAAFLRALVFFDGFEGTPLTFLKLRQLGMQVRVVFLGKVARMEASLEAPACSGSRGQHQVGWFLLDQENCLLTSDWLLGKTTPDPCPPRPSVSVTPATVMWVCPRIQRHWIRPSLFQLLEPSSKQTIDFASRW